MFIDWSRAAGLMWRRTKMCGVEQGRGGVEALLCPGSNPDADP